MNDNSAITHEIKLKKLLSGLIRKKVHFFENLSGENSENKVLFALSSSLILYNFHSGFIISKFNFPSRILDFYIENKSPNYVYCLLDNSFLKFDLENRTIIQQFIVNQKIHEITFSVYLNSFILVGKGNSLFILNKNDITHCESIEINEIKNISNIDVSSDGKFLYFSQKSSFFYYNFLNKMLANIEFPAHITNIKVLKQQGEEDESLCVGDISGKLHFVTILNINKKIYNIQTKHWHSHKVNAMNISPNGQYFFTGGREGVIVFWNIMNETKKFMPRLNSEISSISISSNSSIIAVVLKENKIKFINLFNNSIINEFNGISLNKNFENDNVHYAQFGSLNSLVLFNEKGTIQIYNLNQGCIDFSFNVIQKNFVSNTNNEQINNRRLKLLKFSLDYEYFVTLEELSYNNNYLLSCLKFWKITVLDNNFTVNLICVAENPHSEAINTIDSSINSFTTISKDNSFKIWKLSNNNIFECSLTGTYQNESIQSVKVIGDTVFSIINSSLVVWNNGNNIPENVYSLSSNFSNIFYPEHGKEIIIYSDSELCCLDKGDGKAIWNMNFEELKVRNITGNFKTIILTLEKKDDNSKKIIMEIEIKTKKIMRIVALHKKGVKYMHCIDGKINSLILINTYMEIFLSAHSASKKKKKLLKIKTKALNRISEEEADDNHKKTYNLNDDEDHFEYNLKKFKLNK